MLSPFGAITFWGQKWEQSLKTPKSGRLANAAEIPHEKIGFPIRDQLVACFDRGVR